jgi:mannose-6-phosphate isomerase-like protein (cupin superfamily)
MKTHAIGISLFAAVLLAAPAVAQTAMHSRPPEGFKYLPAKEVEALTDKPGPGAKTAFPVDHEDYDVEYAQRSDKGNEPEVHTYRTHYIHVLSGEATLVYGGTVTNAKETSPGQIRGDGIAGGTSQVVRAGDFLQIPAGMPHLFTVASPSVKFRYVVFNARQ